MHNLRRDMRRAGNIRNVAWQLAVCLMATFAVSVSADNSDEKAVLASFEQIVGAYETLNSKLSPSSVVMDSDSLWKKCQSFVGSFKYDVERTQSLVSPYTAEMTFDVSLLCGCRNYYRRDAEADNTIPCPQATGGAISTYRHTHHFAYQRGEWVLTSAQMTVGFDGPSIDCVRHESGECFCLETPNVRALRVK